MNGVPRVLQELPVSSVTCMLMHMKQLASTLDPTIECSAGIENSEKIFCLGKNAE